MGLLPGGLDQTVASKASQKWVDSPLAGDQSFGADEDPGEVEAVPLALAEQGQDAVLGSAPTKLRHPWELFARYHATSYSRVRPFQRRRPASQAWSNTGFVSSDW